MIYRWLRSVLAVLVGHLTGTFLVLVTQPGVAFQDGNPQLLATEGEFVVKNLVLIAGPCWSPRRCRRCAARFADRLRRRPALA